MARAIRIRALLLPLALIAAAGCQDYNFNPVGHCLIQPGSERVKLSDMSTADVLFVVDDSGSMGGEQVKLAENFAAFIANLDATNLARKAAGLEPIDFHVAVTTTSVFQNDPASVPTSCRSDCPGAAGGLVCCQTSSGGTPVAPMKAPKACSTAADCGGLDCRTDCATLLGEKICCDPTTKIAPATDPVACATAGAACGKLGSHFRFDGRCAPGNATDGALYPHGAFVGLGDNPRVLHFDKELYLWDATAKKYGAARDPALPPCSDASQVCNRQGYTAAQLKSWFASQDPVSKAWSGNVIAGTCGSGEEQGLGAGRLAVQKAVASQQLDTRSATGQVASSQAQWLHPNSKLVLVFVGDEDDCASPEDASRGVILSGPPGGDTCVADAGLPPDQRKQFPVAEIVSYVAGLGRPMGAAFIVSTTQSVCQDEACVAGYCCDTVCTGDAAICSDATCGGQAPGTRFLQAAAEFKSKGADVVAGSMCDPNFASILDRIAEIVKPPAGLLLPTQPAGTEVVVLRIATAGGETRKTCRGPAPAGTDLAAAKASYDWWFTATRDQLTDAQLAPTTATRNVYINHATGACEANPGETYSADYLGQIPAGGCQTRADCVEALGGKAEQWTCYAGGDAPSFTQPTPTAPGTCLCGNLGTGSF